jgi:hypothetical protein
MKRCCTCRVDLPVDRFANNRGNTDGLATQCKKCFSAYCAERRKVNQQLIIEAKSIPCADCGNEYPHFVMDLDHLPQFNKKFDLSKAKHKSKALVISEIAKCEVVCANCHRIRTQNRLRG